MQGIRELLERYTRFAPQDAAVRQALAESIRDIVGTTIDRRSIKIIGSVAYVDVPQAEKPAVFMRQGKIIGRAEERLGRASGITAIR